MQVKSETTVGMLVLSGIIIFLYMGFKIGSFRFDSARYNSYIMNFKDISGLTRKAEVKIAGVKVGWVEEIYLIANVTLEAQATIRVLNEFKLYENAQGFVRQEGVLGPKYLEIVAGDSMRPAIKSGGVLGAPSQPASSVDELMGSFKHIASNIESITNSFKSVAGGARGEESLQAIFDNLNKMSHSFANFSLVLERSFVRNENNLDTVLEIGQQIRRIADRLDNDVLPAVQTSIEKMTLVLDRDFNKISSDISSTAQAIEEASKKACDGFSSMNSISAKIDEGKGFIGKLVNEEDTYQDLKFAVQGLKSYFSKMDTLELIFDLHGESMQRPSDGWRHEDSKFFVDMKLFPNENHFYVVQFASSERGYKEENEFIQDYLNKDQEVVNTDNLFIRDQDRLHFTFNRRQTVWHRNQIRFGLQFGKIFNDIALRVGLFEGFGGVGVDFNVPFQSDNFRWVTSFEMYDLTGWNRQSHRYENVINDDRRPHVKWINKMYILQNLYFVFGADDFISKRNSNAFFGAGIRFGDDDIKYLLPSLGGARGFAGQS